MSTIKKVSGEKGPRAATEPAPVGISPILRASWRFASDTAKRFGHELLNDRTQEFLKKLVKRF